MLHLKFKIILKPYFHLYLTFLFRQLDNDDASEIENDIDIPPPPQTKIELIKYHKESKFSTMSPNCKLQMVKVNPR